MTALAATTRYAETPTASIDDLKVGDTVTVLRNLEHPAWRNRAKVSEILGQAQISEIRHIPAIAGVTGWRGSSRPATTMVRLVTGFWYDLADGLQDNSGATRIVSSL